MAYPELFFSTQEENQLNQIENLETMESINTPHSTLSLNYSQNVFEQEDINEIPDNKLESIPSELIYKANNLNNMEDDLPSNVFGGGLFKKRLLDLMRRYRHVFSREVRAEPANLTPFKFNVNKQDWESPKNRTPRRKCDLTRQLELKNIINKLLEAGVIKPS